jgi:hypothetical protein
MNFKQAPGFPSFLVKVLSFNKRNIPEGIYSFFPKRLCSKLPKAVLSDNLHLPQRLFRPQVPHLQHDVVSRPQAKLDCLSGWAQSNNKYIIKKLLFQK